MGSGRAFYRVTVRLLAGDDVLDELSQVIGVRSVRREPLPGGAPWRFLVNAARLLARRGLGAHGPAARPGGRQTTSGCWNDAGTGRSQFPSCVGRRPAGKTGILGWLRPPGTDGLAGDAAGRRMPATATPAARATSRNYQREATGIVRSLRHHPSLIAWCGGNEIDIQREKLQLDLLAAVVAGARPVPTLDPRLAVRRRRAPVERVAMAGNAWTRLADARPPFISEFGLQALPNLARSLKCSPGTLPRFRADPRWARAKRPARQASPLLRSASGGDLALPLPPPNTRRSLPCKSGSRPRDCGAAVRRRGRLAAQRAVAGRLLVGDRPRRAPEVRLRDAAPQLPAALDRGALSWRRYAPGDVFQAEIWLVNDSAQTYAAVALGPASTTPRCGPSTILAWRPPAPRMWGRSRSPWTSPRKRSRFA